MNDETRILFERLKVMPHLSHWPNRMVAFRWDNSQVIAYIRRTAGCDIKAAAKLFEKARDKRVLLFDHQRLTWRGNTAWIPTERKRRKQVESPENCTTADTAAAG